MSDNELEEYLKTIEPNFDSHIEKGTIEMSNEYYNLLEERMIRLLNENKQLKEDYEVLKKLQMISNDILNDLEEWLKEQWYEIEPKGTGINFNCEYDSEEDYVRGMETKSKLDTLKNTLNKIQELKEKYK